MRLDLRPPPTAAELLKRTPHELVRDFPETLAVFRRHDVDLSRLGARPLGEWKGDGADELAGPLRRALRWRAEEGGR